VALVYQRNLNTKGKLGANEMTTEEFDRFYRSHVGPTRNYALSLGLRYHDAEDLVHDVLLEVWRKGQRCALRTMVWQRAIKLGRRREREVGLASPQCQTVDTAQHVDVVDSLGCASELDQLIVSLKFDGLTDAKIGRQLGMTRAGVGKRVRKLRTRFSDRL
jgi:DNA-directed RNA polymerase specialized sigma24 family protein